MVNMEVEPGAYQSKSEFDEAYGDDEREIRGAILTEPLGKVPRRNMLTVTSTASVGDVVRAMNQSHVGCTLVLREGKLAGIFTERDALRKVALADFDVERTPISAVMTPNPDTLPETASIAFALRKMSQEGYRHIPLVDALMQPVGVVAVRDIVSWMVELFPESVLNLPPEPVYPQTIDGG